MNSDRSSDYDRLDALLAQNLAPIGYKLEPCAQQAELNASVLLSASEDSDVEMGTGVSSVAAGVESCMPCGQDEATASDPTASRGKARNINLREHQRG
eukprot:2878714-Pleurochrysis_carterae.AAC.1